MKTLLVTSIYLSIFPRPH